jgi:sec-independent protein translocase protein TatA
MGRIGPMELVVIVFAILMLFGVKRLPEVGAALGKAIREFKKAAQGVEDEINKGVQDKNDK